MKTLKRNSSQNFPVKLNYKSNEVLFTYKGGKSTSNLKLINVNKNKNLKGNKNYSSFDKNLKEETSLIQKNFKSKGNKKVAKSPLNSHLNNNIKFQSFVNKYNANDKKKNIKYLFNNRDNFFENKNKKNENNKSNFFLKNNVKYSINNTISNVNTNNNIKKSICSFKKIHDKNLFNKKQIYHKPKNERKIISSSLALENNSNHNKENINLNTNSNTNNNYIYTNLNKIKKYDSYTPKFPDISQITANNEDNNISNFLYCNTSKNNNSFFVERKTNNNISNLNLNLYSPREENLHCLKRAKSNLRSDQIINDINDNISFISDKNLKNYNANSNSIIYIRKNNFSKELNKSNIINTSTFSTKNNNSNSNIINDNKCNSNKNIKINENNQKKIRVNLKSSNIFENAFYVQKNVLLIQKNYRMHLSILKRYILKAIKNIIEGTNKLYYIFYKYYYKKLIYIINNAYIKSIDVNIKPSIIRPKINNNILNEISLNNNYSKTKFYYIMNHQMEINKKYGIMVNKDYNNIKASKTKTEFNLNNKNSYSNKIQRNDIVIIKNLKNQIISKLQK